MKLGNLELKTECIETLTQKHNVCKATFNHEFKLSILAKYLSVHLQTKYLYVQV